MDPMTEMFCDESNVILHNLRRNLFEKKGQSCCYEQDTVQEIFRSVHTLKADSMMMLYDDMAQISKDFESLLYCFRGEGKRICDTERFNRVLLDYITFFEKEIDRILEGFTPEDKAVALQQRIQEYTREMTSQMEEEEKEKYHLELSKPKRQVFYIAGTVSDAEDAGEAMQEEMEENVQEDSVVAFHAKEKKTYMISQEERDKIWQSSRNISRIVDGLEYALGDGSSGTFSREQFMKLQTVREDLEMVKKSLANTDFVPVAKKMEIVVDEMSQKLKKPAKLLVKGENTPIDLEKREKISSALIHIIRNAMDHGIEEMEKREMCGKSPMGLIKLKFSTENGRVKVSVSDDGAGIDTDKVLERAKQQNMLTKLPEEYTRQEIINLVLLNGVSTAPEVTEYSGRGVGMDVISHNVKEMGGKLKLSSEPGMGTKVTMKF